MIQATSPVITKPVVKKLTFPEAIKEVINGKKITKEEWEDKESYGMLKDGFLMIHLKEIFHKWVVNDGDLLGEDWIVINETN